MSHRIQKCSGRRRRRTIGPLKWPGSQSVAATTATEMTTMFAITLITSSVIMFDFQPFVVAIVPK